MTLPGMQRKQDIQQAQDKIMMFISPGSKIFLKTDRTFPVFAEDIRMINIEMDTRTRGRGADQRVRYTPPTEVRARLDTIMYQ